MDLFPSNNQTIQNFICDVFAMIKTKTWVDQQKHLVKKN